jgi:hypothetical protein
MRYKKPSVSCPKTNGDGLKKNSVNKFNGGVKTRIDVFGLVGADFLLLLEITVMIKVSFARLALTFVGVIIEIFDVE